MANSDGTIDPYEYHKMHHRCTTCLKVDAYTLAGRVLCAECSEKNNERMRQSYKRDPSKKLQAQRERYAKLRDAGICLQCGKNPVLDAPMHSRCGSCRAKNARRRTQYKKTDTANQCGLCYRCFKKLDDPDARICRSCAEQLADAAAKGRKTIAQSEPNGFRKSIEKQWEDGRKKRGDTNGQG